MNRLLFLRPQHGEIRETPQITREFAVGTEQRLFLYKDVMRRALCSHQLRLTAARMQRSEREIHRRIDPQAALTDVANIDLDELGVPLLIEVAEIDVSPARPVSLSAGDDVRDFRGRIVVRYTTGRGFPEASTESSAFVGSPLALLRGWARRR